MLCGTPDASEDVNELGKIIDNSSSTAKCAKHMAKIRQVRYVGHRSWVPLSRVDVQTAAEI